MSTQNKRYAKTDDHDYAFTGSPAVERVEMFRIDGQLFDSFEKAVSSREDKVEKFFRPLLNNLSPIAARDQITVIDWILTNRAELGKLLNY